MDRDTEPAVSFLVGFLYSRLLVSNASLGVAAAVVACLYFRLVPAGALSSGSSSAGANANSRDFDTEFFVLEERPARSYVGSVADLTDIGPAYRQSTHFRFLSTTAAEGLTASGGSRGGGGVGDISSAFTISETTGEIRTQRPIDRDRLCPRAVHCVVRLDVVVQLPVPNSSSLPLIHLLSFATPASPGSIELVRVGVHVLDINDNAPTFPSPIISRSLPESAGPGSAGFLCPAAEDIDGPPYGIQSYTLKTVASGGYDVNVSPFNVSVIGCSGSAGGSGGGGGMSSAVDGLGCQLRITPTEHLDREKVDSYQLTIVAVDGGDQPLSGTLLVVVSILDVNDNSPTFSDVAYETRVPEDAGAGTVVFRVTADDPDLGPNGRLRYAFTDETESAHGDEFGVRPETGTIYTRRRLDYETEREYTLYLMASDRGGDRTDPDSLTGMTSVLVRVDDVNDNAPEIEFNFRQQHGQQLQNGNEKPPTVLVDRDAPVGTFVAHVSVRDADSGENGRFRCVLTSSSSTADTSANVSGSSRRHRFSLRQLYTSEFVILTSERLNDTSEGQTSSSARNDPSVRYSLTVYCADGGRPQLTAEAMISAVVRSNVGFESDENDVIQRKPVTERTYRVIVSRDVAIGTPVFCSRSAFNADDDLLHLSTDNRLTFKISDANFVTTGGVSIGWSAKEYFDIDPETGIVSTKNRFDRQSADEFSKRPMCRAEINADADYVVDAGQNRKSIRLKVVVFLLDSNASFGSTFFSHDKVRTDGKSFAVTENRPSGTKVGRITPPICLFGDDVSFILRASSANEVFTANEGGRGQTAAGLLPFDYDAKTGIISTNRELDSEQERDYELVIVVQFQATAATSPSHSADSFFNGGCDSTSGSIRSGASSTSNAAGRMKKGSRTGGTGTGNGSGNGPQFEFRVADFRVAVDDVNDNWPTIEFSSPAVDVSVGDAKRATVEVPCDAPPGHVITRIIGLDTDLGDNSKLGYRLYYLSPETTADFEKVGIKFSTGVIYVTSPFGCSLSTSSSEQVREMIAVVNVTDSGRPPLSSSALLRILVVGPGGSRSVGGVLWADGLQSVLTSDTLAIILASVLGILSAAIGTILGLVVCMRCRRRSRLSRTDDVAVVASNDSEVNRKPVPRCCCSCCCYMLSATSCARYNAVEMSSVPVADAKREPTSGAKSRDGVAKESPRTAVKANHNTGVSNSKQPSATAVTSDQSTLRDRQRTNSSKFVTQLQQQQPPSQKDVQIALKPVVAFIRTDASSTEIAHPPPPPLSRESSVDSGRGPSSVGLGSHGGPAVGGTPRFETGGVAAWTNEARNVKVDPLRHRNPESFRTDAVDRPSTLSSPTQRSSVQASTSLHRHHQNNGSKVTPTPANDDGRQYYGLTLPPPRGGAGYARQTLLLRSAPFDRNKSSMPGIDTASDDDSASGSKNFRLVRMPSSDAFIGGGRRHNTAEMDDAPVGRPPEQISMAASGSRTVAFADCRQLPSTTNWATSVDSANEWRKDNNAGPRGSSSPRHVHRAMPSNSAVTNTNAIFAGKMSLSSTSDRPRRWLTDVVTGRRIACRSESMDFEEKRSLKMLQQQSVTMVPAVRRREVCEDVVVCRKAVASSGGSGGDTHQSRSAIGRQTEECETEIVL